MDIDDLQGSWRNGAATITVDGNRFTTSQMGAEYTGHFEIDEAAAPKRLTLYFESGPEAGNTNCGIYSLGEDGWRICLNMAGGPAPDEFGEAVHNGIAMIVYTRKQPAAAPAGGASVAELQGEWAMVSCIRAGEPLPASLVKFAKRTVAGTESKLHFGPQLFSHGVLSEDGPGSFRMESLAGEGPQYGIYSFAGDVLKTCTSAPGGPRPTEYTSTKAGGETYTEWKRR